MFGSLAKLLGRGVHAEVQGAKNISNNIAHPIESLKNLLYPTAPPLPLPVPLRPANPGSNTSTIDLGLVSNNATSIPFFKRNGVPFARPNGSPVKLVNGLPQLDPFDPNNYSPIKAQPITANPSLTPRNLY